MTTQQDILSVLKDFYAISGFRVSVHDVDCNEIYCYPKETSPFCKALQKSEQVRAGCIQCDKTAFERVKTTNKPYVYRCQCGLYEAVAPIYHYGVLSGYLMMGQVRDETKENAQQIKQRARRLFKSEQELEQYFNKITVIPTGKIKSYLTIMTLVAEDFTKNNRLSSNNESLSELVCRYLNKNYQKKITLDELSQKFGRCKSTIMNNFQKSYGVTVIDYLNKVRLQHAEKLVRNTEYSFKEISYHCGFNDQNYFSRLFSEGFSLSPSEYRKMAVATRKSGTKTQS